jgi:hypothetical protein
MGAALPRNWPWDVATRACGYYSRLIIEAEEFVRNASS